MPKLTPLELSVSAGAAGRAQVFARSRSEYQSESRARVTNQHYKKKANNVFCTGFVKSSLEGKARTSPARLIVQMSCSIYALWKLRAGAGRGDSTGEVAFLIRLTASSTLFRLHTPRGLGNDVSSHPKLELRHLDVQLDGSHLGRPQPEVLPRRLVCLFHERLQLTLAPSSHLYTAAPCPANGAGACRGPHPRSARRALGGWVGRVGQVGQVGLSGCVSSVSRRLT